MISSGGGAELPTVLIDRGIAQRYGLQIQIVPYTTPGQQFLLLRSGAVDVVPGSVLDLMRQRQAGLDLYAFSGFQRFSSPVVVGAGSTIGAFDDLRGARVGEFGPTLLDWLVLRAAAKRAYGWDLQEANLTQASPALLTALLADGKIDAALQFANLVVGPVARGEQRVLTTVPDVMRAAGLDPDAIDVTWNISGSWEKTHVGQLERLRAAMAEAYQVLATDDTAWPPLVELLGIDPHSSTAAAYIALERRISNPPFQESLLPPTQHLLDVIVSEIGDQDTRVRQIDRTAFLFP
ncbi:MAG: ABC transporter substrate-binding protein [Dermatophilaceae bacterium]